MNRKYFLSFLLCLCAVLPLAAQQDGTVMNRPYTDLRPFHFGILVGTHLQDFEFQNVGSQTVTAADGSQQTYLITCDQDSWDNGFNVGVLGEARLSEYFQFRVAPMLYFGTRHIQFHNMDPQAPDSLINRSQSMKTVYIGCSMDLIFAAQRAGNHRPYVMAGISPVINLTNTNNDYINLKRYDFFLEAGIGCDFYLPFFKLRPELKFMWGLTNSLDRDHANQLQDASMRPYAQSIRKSTSKLICLTFHFE